MVLVRSFSVVPQVTEQTPVHSIEKGLTSVIHNEINPTKEVFAWLFT